MKYVVTAWVLNETNFVRKYDTYDEAKVIYDKFESQEDCFYLELTVECSSTVHKIDKRLSVYTVRYLDFGYECEQDFLSVEEAEKFMVDYAYKYENMELY